MRAECGFGNVGAIQSSTLLAIFGPTLRVRIGFDLSYQPGQAPPPLAIKEIPALIDTGAGDNCIDSLLAAELKLPVVDRRSISGVHGSYEVNMHLAQIYIPELEFTIYGGPFAGVHLSRGSQSHLVLIGRGFLRHCTMVYDGRTGSVTIDHSTV